MKRYCLWACLIILIACDREAQPIEDQVFSQITLAIYDSILVQSELPDGNVILINPMDDHLDSTGVFWALESIEDKSSKDYLMISKLAGVLNDHIEFDFSSLSESFLFKLISNKEEIENFDFEKNSLVGVSTISPIIFDKEQQEALLYADFQCRNKCTGGGYLIFLSIGNNGWKIGRMMPLWES